MKSKTELRQELERIHRKSYPAYKDLRGQYDFGDYVLSIDHVHGGSVRVPVQCQCGGSHEKGGIPGIVLEGSVCQDSPGRLSAAAVCEKTAGLQL